MSVIEFRRKPPPPTPLPEAAAVWQCNCGCEVFWLYQDGRVECPECNVFHDEMTGYWAIVAVESDSE